MVAVFVFLMEFLPFYGLAVAGPMFHGEPGLHSISIVLPYHT